MDRVIVHLFIWLFMCIVFSGSSDFFLSYLLLSISTFVHRQIHYSPQNTCCIYLPSLFIIHSSILPAFHSLFYPSIPSSTQLSTLLSTYPSTPLSTHLSTYPPSTHLSIHLGLSYYPPSPLPTYLSYYKPTLFPKQTTPPPIHLSIHPPTLAGG